MAKQLINSAGEESLQPLPPLRPTPPRTARKWSLAILGTAVVVAISMSVAYLALPDELPLIWQRLVGLGCAVLAVAALAVTTRETESPEEEMLDRIRRGQHADFGKRLREAQQVRTTIRLPVVGKTSIRRLVGLGVFGAVGGWWLSPWAPVGIRKRAIEDMARPLAEEIAAVVLVMCEEQVAILQPPIPPQCARQTAMSIDDDQANSYQLGLKAIALGRFDEARHLLAQAMRNDDARPEEIRLARAYNEMYAGRFEDATDRYNDALQKGHEDPLLLCQMAVARMHDGKFDQAEPLVFRALEVCRKSPTEEDPALAVCLHVQAALHVGLGKDYDQAVLMCLQTRKILEETLDREHPFEAASLNNQATLYLLQAKYEGGHELYRRAGDLWARTVGRHHPYVAASLGNLAVLHYKLGQYAKVDDQAKDQAKELVERAFAIRSRSLPDDHPILGIGGDTSALVYQGLAQYETAQPLAEKSLAISENALGPGHASVAAGFHTLARVYTGQAQHTQAELFYLRAETVAGEVWGPDHPYPAAILNDLAGLYIVRGRFEEAEKLSAHALDILQGALGEKHPAVANVLNTRGELEIARGEPRNARPPLNQALKIRRKAFGNDHPDIARTLTNLAALDALSPLNYSRGVTRYQRAIEMLDGLLGLEHPSVARPLCGLAELWVRQEKYSEAEACLKRALAVQEQSLVPFHPDLAATLEAYASLLRKANPPDPETADEMEARAKSIRAAHAEEDRAEPGDAQR